MNIELDAFCEQFIDIVFKECKLLKQKEAAITSQDQSYFYLTFTWAETLDSTDWKEVEKSLNLYLIDKSVVKASSYYDYYAGVSAGVVWGNTLDIVNVHEHYRSKNEAILKFFKEVETHGYIVKYAFHRSYLENVSRKEKKDQFDLFCSFYIEESEEKAKLHKNKINARKMGLIENFSQFEKSLNEGTIEGYRYHFNFEDKKYYITQGTKNKTLFGIKDKDSGKWKVLTKGDLFDPAKNGMDRNEMVEFIQRGIKYFNIRNPVEIEDVKESEWSKFFKYELDNKPGRLNKKYVILKLQCGKAQCKWHTRDK
jgi:hypothetical protein